MIIMSQYFNWALQKVATFDQTLPAIHDTTLRDNRVTKPWFAFQAKAMVKTLPQLKLEGVGPVDNRPLTN